MNFLKKIALFVVIVASIYGVGRLGVKTYDSYLFVQREPYMVMQTQNSITIKWQTPKFETGEVEYGFFYDTLNKSIKTKKTKKHSVTISELNECTKYYYRVNSDSLKIDNEGRSFSTLCKSADKQRLWVIGDSGKKGQAKLDVLAQLVKYIDGNYNKLDMWVLLGDNAYTSGTQEQFNTTLFDPYIEMIKRFVPWAVPGNHDARRWAFYQIFDFPTQGESGGVASEHEEFYSIDNGNLHLVMLDSETVGRGTHSDMTLWLKEDLKANTKPWVIVAFHTPPYSDGGHKSDDSSDSGGRMKDMRENFVPIFDEFGVDLVLSGHSHGYERSKLILNHLGKSETFSKDNILQNQKTDYKKSLLNKKNSGTIYQICGSSAKLDRATYNHPAMPYSFEKMGSLIIELTPSTLSSKFLTIDGEIKDEFIITKER